MRIHRHLIAALALSSISWAAQADSPAQWQTLTRDVQISLEQAIQNATKTVPGKALEVELDDGKGTGVRYEVQVLTPAGDSVEVWVNAADGQARLHANDGPAKRKEAQRAEQAKIDMSKAIQAATAHTPGKAVKAELDNHWGTVTYQVDVLQPDFTVMEIKVDAANGQVLRAKKD